MVHGTSWDAEHTAPDALAPGAPGLGALRSSGGARRPSEGGTGASLPGRTGSRTARTSPRAVVVTGLVTEAPPRVGESRQPSAPRRGERRRVRHTPVTFRPRRSRDGVLLIRGLWVRSPRGPPDLGFYLFFIVESRSESLTAIDDRRSGTGRANPQVHRARRCRHARGVVVLQDLNPSVGVSSDVALGDARVVRVSDERAAERVRMAARTSSSSGSTATAPAKAPGRAAQPRSSYHERTRTSTRTPPQPRQPRSSRNPTSGCHAPGGA